MNCIAERNNMKTIYSNKENVKETLLSVIECLNRNE